MKTKNKITNILIYILLSFLSVIWLLPILWIIIASFNGDQTGPTPVVNFANIEGEGLTYYLNGLKDILIPSKFTLDNYINLFIGTGQFNFTRWFLNTLFVAVCTCIISTTLILSTSYAFSRLRFKMRKSYMNIILLLGLFPGFLTMFAVYNILKYIGLDQSLFGLILVYSGSASMGYYICKGFFDTIPIALDESAHLDGATKLQIFTKITIPLSKPIVIYTTLTSFLAPWLDFIFAKFIMGTKIDNYTVAIGLYKMLEKEFINDYFTQFCAGAVIVAIPIAILFIFMQKFYVEGVTGGAVK
ncbi:MAG: ABC transporter permease subunit [bacterium]